MVDLANYFETGTSVGSLLLILMIIFFPAIIIGLKAILLDAKITGSPTSVYRATRNPPINGAVYYPYGISEMQGKRPYMEDRHIAFADFEDDSMSFYGVFDGHGGSTASQFCADHLPQNLRVMSTLKSDPAESLKTAFLLTDKAYLDLASKRGLNDGTTALALLVHGENLYVANAGDSRAILIQKGGKVVPLSNDHKPNRPDEKERITAAGGHVVFWGVWRVEGILAVSRAVGDRMLKDLVTAEPEIQSWRRTEEDLFVMLASDGVWDTLSNDEAGSIVLKATDPKTAAREVMEEAYNRGSLDNICVLVVDIRAPRDSKNEEREESIEDKKEL